MTKIFVMAGTEEGRKLAEFLSCKGYEVTASVTSDYGRKILEQYEFGVNDKKLDAAELAEFLREGKFNIMVDASHPYALRASTNAIDACLSISIPYVRFERSESVTGYSRAYHVDGYESAAKMAATLGKNIF